jgi:hypothetical protein
LSIIRYLNPKPIEIYQRGNYMDPFTEKQLIDNLKLISGTLMGIKAELADLNVAVREANEIALDNGFSNDDEDEEGSEASEDSLGDEETKENQTTKLEDADEGFAVAEDDTIVDSDNKLVPDEEDSEENLGTSF